jgi:hypothetical protein
MGEKRNASSVLVAKPYGKGPTGKSRHRWVDNIEIYLGEVGWSVVD